MLIHQTPLWRTALKIKWISFPLFIAALSLLVAANSNAYDVSHLGFKTISYALVKNAKKFTESSLGNNASVTVPATGTMEVAFSPNEGAEALVIKAIESAHTDIRVMAYSFTSAPVTQALIDARHKGVKVTMVVDHKSNVSEDKSGKARAALSALANAGAEVRTISVYPIAHDKVCLIDGVTTELGSFNYSAAAANRNSENVLVAWNNPALAKVYLGHFERNYRQSEPFATRY